MKSQQSEKILETLLNPVHSDSLLIYNFSKCNFDAKEGKYVVFDDPSLAVNLVLLFSDSFTYVYCDENCNCREIELLTPELIRRYKLLISK